MQQSTRMLGLLLLITATAPTQAHEYEKVLAKPGRYTTAMTLVGASTFLSGRSLVRSFKTRNPAMAALSLGTLCFTSGVFVATENCCAKPMILTNSRCEALASYGQATRIGITTDSEHDAARGLVRVINAGFNKLISACVHAVDDISGIFCDDPQKK